MTTGSVRYRRSPAPARSLATGRSPGTDCHWQSMKPPTHPAMAAAAGVFGHFTNVPDL